jgi:lipoprotein-releasing system ATP-binding protein
VSSEPVLELSAVVKDYRGLRPLRIGTFVLAEGESVAMLGFDEPMAEVFVNLVTGAAVPDRGEIRAFGMPTTAIASSADWLQIVDRFGIVSRRAVLLDAMTAIQNLSLPYTLDIEPPSDEVREKALALAAEVGISASISSRPVSQLDLLDHARLRLGRALALAPSILLLEHASADIPRDSVRTFGADIQSIARQRRCAAIALTADPEFATAVAARVLRLDAASGTLVSAVRRRWW